MSRGFVKEGDQEEAPIIPPRAALPAGAINYVTPHGMDMLLAERESLEEERDAIATDDEDEHRRESAVVNEKLNLLQERINSARVLDPLEQPQDEVRFGAEVSYQIGSDKTVHTLQIVGVDEADVQAKKIAFVAPIARALTGKKIGDIADFKLGSEVRKLKVIDIKY